MKLKRIALPLFLSTLPVALLGCDAPPKPPLPTPTPAPTTPSPVVMVIPTLPKPTATPTPILTPGATPNGTPNPNGTPDPNGPPDPNAASAPVATSSGAITSATATPAPIPSCSIQNDSARTQQIDFTDDKGQPVSSSTLPPGGSAASPAAARSFKVTYSGKSATFDRPGMRFKIDRAEDLVTVN